jgi:hypothetical protein
MGGEERDKRNASPGPPSLLPLPLVLLVLPILMYRYDDDDVQYRAYVNFELNFDDNNNTVLHLDFFNAARM